MEQLSGICCGRVVADRAETPLALRTVTQNVRKDNAVFVDAVCYNSGHFMMAASSQKSVSAQIQLMLLNGLNPPCKPTASQKLPTRN